MIPRSNTMTNRLLLPQKITLGSTANPSRPWAFYPSFARLHARPSLARRPEKVLTVSCRPGLVFAKAHHTATVGFFAWNQTHSTASDLFKFCPALLGCFSAVVITFFARWSFQKSNARRQQTQKSRLGKMNRMLGTSRQFPGWQPNVQLGLRGRRRIMLNEWQVDRVPPDVRPGCRRASRFLRASCGVSAGARQ